MVTSSATTSQALSAPEEEPSTASKAEWVVPDRMTSPAVMLYFHGGGYAFYADVSRRQVEVLVSATGIRTFVPDYRLTPEHSHPAQLEDGVAAYRYLLNQQGVDPKRIVIAGDSAGGHLALMTMIALRDAGLPQPALVIGLCPWTDISARGARLFNHNKFDLVQGYQAIRYANWLKGTGKFSDEELSPIHHDYRDLAPIYLQAGGKEILVDMIRDFAEVQRSKGADVTLDVWDDMTHNFQANGGMLVESRQALQRLSDQIAEHVQATTNTIAEAPI